jgi:hypothetical protein
VKVDIKTTLIRQLAEREARRVMIPLYYRHRKSIIKTPPKKEGYEELLLNPKLIAVNSHQFRRIYYSHQGFLQKNN